ncbi:MAG: hypothetical protein HRU70_10905 [Phycisphaeraceae bacterium]|nr:MAG: hypothetical protein HRU70_10905 [Phycisphaeraceae bacterium]
MKTTMMRMTVSVRAMTVAVALIGCAVGVGPFAPSAAIAQIKSVGDVKTLMKPELPAGALEITAAMKSAKVGETITVRGNVAMSKDAFVENRSMFTLVDESTRLACCPPVDKLPDTACNIPAEGRATVQIVDANGKPLRAGLSGQHGLKPGAEVFVTGKVETANGTDALVLTVVSMHVPKAPLPSGFFVEKQPENGKDVSEVRKAGTLKAGDEVVLRGRIGGSKEPFVAGRAVFTLIGRGLKACNENPDDKCSKPWDYCCETKEDILANSVTVQVVDTKGQILRTDMKGRRGLKELSEIVVVGKIASADGKSVVVNASSVYAVH